jgi:hypothetical protein
MQLFYNAVSRLLLSYASFVHLASMTISEAAKRRIFLV